MLNEQLNRKAFLAKTLLFFFFIALTYGIGGWVATALAVVLLILPPTLLNLVWKIQWFKTFENTSPVASQTIKLVTYGVLIALLILVFAYVYVLTHFVPLPSV